MTTLRVTVKPVVDALARAGLLMVRFPRRVFGSWDVSIQRFVVLLPKL